MNDVSTMASSMVAMNQSRLYEQIAISMIRMNARTEQALADMLSQNARRIEALSGNSSVEGIDLFI